MNEREAQKERWERFRAAARRLYPHAKIGEYCHVDEPADRDGGFIAITVWIPKEELQCGAINSELRLTCSLQPDHLPPHHDNSRTLYFYADGEQPVYRPSHND